MSVMYMFTCDYKENKNENNNNKKKEKHSFERVSECLKIGAKIGNAVQKIPFLLLLLLTKTH